MAIDRAQIKDLIVEYFGEVPVYRYAAQYAGISEDTLMVWRKDDPEFSGRLEVAKALWIRKRLKDVKPDWALERLEREIFAPPKQAMDLGGGENPVRILLNAYGIEVKDDGKVDEPVQGPSDSPA